MTTKSTFFKYLFLLLSALVFLSTPLTALAQVEEITKTPSLERDAEDIEEYPNAELPDNYPQELLDWYAANMDARSYVVVDVETNRILAEEQAFVPYPIASMSKILAVYLIYKEIEAGTISLDTMVTVPQDIEDYLSFNPELSAVGLHAGVEYSVEDLIYGIMMLSGNDATSTMMWELFGDEQTAVQKIREQLLDWGLVDFEFYTTSGVPNMYIPEEWWMPGSNENSENRLSAADVALVAQYIVEEFPQILDVSSTVEYVFMEGTDYESVFTTSNLLLPGMAYGRSGTTGLKSGLTDAAGRTFVATINENDRDLIVVSMGLFDRADGLQVSSYWEIEILLDGLLDYPDMYQNEDLPTNMRLTRAEREAELASLEEEESQASQVEESVELENRRDNPITNFMRSIFNFFQ
ncbi:D-alanyl-D-alanine carboxypeptidase family protein [Fundicoccus culcitae]|uniref:Serine hydrolase n=1 Tax=Fundicoccus culcitae TaxID=2969821 RepID=A0ABY5P6G2_9LACT|nr:serine hydrolase [Fundicoccus culcitae]UUX34171.1 serine hydrolase [Fundicoccus culcitae]